MPDYLLIKEHVSVQNLTTEEAAAKVADGWTATLLAPEDVRPVNPIIDEYEEDGWREMTGEELAAHLETVHASLHDLDANTVTFPDQSVIPFRVYRFDADAYPDPAWVLGDPDVMACETCELFMALGDYAACGMASQRVVYNDAWDWPVKNAPLHLDMDGQITATAPVSPTFDGEVGRIVGKVRDAHSILFNGRIPGGVFSVGES